MNPNHFYDVLIKRSEESNITANALILSVGCDYFSNIMSTRYGFKESLPTENDYSTSINTRTVIISSVQKQY